MTGHPLEQVLSDPAIPALPAVMSKAIERSPAGADAREELIERFRLDPALTLAILGRVNSERNSGERVANVAIAVEALAGPALRAVVLGVPVGNGRSEDLDAIEFEFEPFWCRAIRASVAARQVAQVTRSLDPERASVAALLADVGMVALHQAFGDRYLQVLDIAGRDHRTLIEVERRTLRIDHAMVGAELASRARLPEAIVSAIRHHHEHRTASREERSLAAIVELANVAALAIDEPSLLTEDATVRFRRSAHAWFGIPPHESLVLLEEMRAESSHRLRIAGIGDAHDADALRRRIADARRAVGLAGPLPPPATFTRDPLTGLPDRDSFLERLDAALGIERPRGGSVAMLVASIDDLRALNLRLGVRGGDALIRAVAVRLASTLPAGCDAFRLMGGQFAILAPGLSPLETRRLADDLRRAVTSELIEVAGERAVRVTLSVGAAIDRFAPEHPGSDVAPARENLVRDALGALAAAESAGRNRTELHRDDRDAA